MIEKNDKCEECDNLNSICEDRAYFCRLDEIILKESLLLELYKRKMRNKSKKNINDEKE